MVQAGFTGVDDVFTGPRNFFFAYTQNPKPEQADRGARHTLRDHADQHQEMVRRVSPIQAPLDCIEKMLREEAIAADDIDHVTLRLSNLEHSVVDDRHMPDICIQHMVAIMLLDRTRNLCLRA